MAAKRRRSGARTKAAFTRENRVEEVFELEFLQGLRPFVLKDLKAYKGATVRAQGEDALQLSYGGKLSDFFKLRYVVAVYLKTSFDVPRPKALLGDEHFRRLVAAIDRVRSLQPPGTFKSFRFNAAGSDSTVFVRLAEAITRVTGLRFDAEEGELLLRVRRVGAAWEVLTRLTPRPLSARSWRVCNLPGGLNATLAAAMNDLAKPKSGERYLNTMCGSGTLLVEQALENRRVDKEIELVGCDISAEALKCAHANLNQIHHKPSPELFEADARQLPFQAESFDVITADLPWGDAVGTHEANAELYPAFLAEAARVARSAARLVVLTHEIKLFERTFEAQRHWRLIKEQRVFHGGHYPRIYVLEKK